MGVDGSLFSPCPAIWKQMLRTSTGCRFYCCCPFASLIDAKQWSKKAEQRKPPYVAGILLKRNRSEGAKTIGCAWLLRAKGYHSVQLGKERIQETITSKRGAHKSYFAEGKFIHHLVNRRWHFVCFTCPDRQNWSIGKKIPTFPQLYLRLPPSSWWDVWLAVDITHVKWVPWVELIFPLFYIIIIITNTTTTIIT